MPPDALRDLTFCTYSTGELLVREVLEDWFEFLGGKPKSVIFTVTPADNPPAIYGSLEDEGLIDRVIYLDPKGRNAFQLDIPAIRAAVEAAETEWILLAKLDTLPFRKGHENWLDETMSALEGSDCIGLSGSAATYYDVWPAPRPFVRIRKFSNNFALIRRDDWLAIQDLYVGRNIDGPLTKRRFLKGNAIRLAGEFAVDKHLRDNGLFLLARRESRNWSVFHVNVWGEKLRKVREDYRARAHVGPHLFRGTPHGKYAFTRHWIRYYGRPAPSFGKLVKKYLYYFRYRFFGVP